VALTATVQPFVGPDRDPAEEALVAGLQRGDPVHVEDFLRRSHRAVYALAARLTPDADLRHDWSQEALLRILDEMARGHFVYRRPGCFWAWFRTRAHFLLLNEYRRQRTHDQRWTTGEVGEELVDRLPLSGGGDPLRTLESVDARRIIEECLDELASEDHRRALHLVLFQEQQYQDVADLLDATLNTVRSWIRRARIAMRQCVAAKYEYGKTEDS